MLGDNRISAVLVSTDLEASQDFYENKVGLLLSDGDHREPSRLRVRQRHNAARSTAARSGNLADHTQVRFWSTDVDKDVAELVERGIVFEEYDMGAFKTVDHVVTSAGIGRSAWFKDPDGNTIAIFQPE